jgi:hypothetical protein
MNWKGYDIRTEENHKKYVRIAGLRTDIWAHNLLNIKQKCLSASGFICCCQALIHTIRPPSSPHQRGSTYVWKIKTADLDPFGVAHSRTLLLIEQKINQDLNLRPRKLSFTNQRLQKTDIYTLMIATCNIQIYLSKLLTLASIIHRLVLLTDCMNLRLVNQNSPFQARCSSQYIVDEHCRKNKHILGR